jgi:hypothetical protein
LPSVGSAGTINLAGALVLRIGFFACAASLIYSPALLTLLLLE